MLRLVLIWKIVINPVLAFSNDMNFSDINSNKLVFDRENSKATLLVMLLCIFKK
ncbi:MAG UNVERIFIED_CONTAM: hypothetical protein LVQ98_09050 [Rickettsiaceae bacterium]